MLTINTNILRTLKGAMHNMITERDNSTVCPVRIGGMIIGVLSACVYIGLGVYSVVELHQTFMAADFGSGLAEVWGVVAASIGLKAFTEKQPC